MALRFLLDENMSLAVLRAVVHHNAQGLDVIDALRVGEEGTPPFGSPDPEILIWAEKNGRILISYDKASLPGHFAEHLLQGHHCTGIFVIKPSHSTPEIVELLRIASGASEAEEWIDRIYYVE